MATGEINVNIVILINDQHAHDVLGCAGFGELKTAFIDEFRQICARYGHQARHYEQQEWGQLTL